MAWRRRRCGARFLASGADVRSTGPVRMSASHASCHKSCRSNPRPVPGLTGFSSGRTTDPVERVVAVDESALLIQSAVAGPDRLESPPSPERAVLGLVIANGRAAPAAAGDRRQHGEHVLPRARGRRDDRRPAPAGACAVSHHRNYVAAPQQPGTFPGQRTPHRVSRRTGSARHRPVRRSRRAASLSLTR